MDLKYIPPRKCKHQSIIRKKAGRNLPESSLMKRDKKPKRTSVENENNSIQSFPVSYNYKVKMMIYFNDSINLAGDLSEEYLSNNNAWIYELYYCASYSGRFNNLKS
jgi:hypothetical protein